MEGVKFLWDSCFENVDLIANGNKGSGCILAHCMGLGKTLTTITLIHTVLAQENLTRVHRVLVVMPVNVLANWHREINKWTQHCQHHVNVYEMDRVNGPRQGSDLAMDRLVRVKTWYDRGGIFLIGYTLLKRIIGGKNLSPVHAQEFATYFTNPGADLIVCDEGHQLKNLKSNVNRALNQVNCEFKKIILRLEDL